MSDWSSDVCSSDLEAEALHREHRFDRFGFVLEEVLLQLRDRLQRALLGGTDRRLDHRHQHTLVFIGQEGTGQACEQQAHHQRQRREHRHEPPRRSEEHTSELQSLMRISYAVFCLKKKKYAHHPPTMQTPTNKTTQLPTTPHETPYTPTNTTIHLTS